MRILVVGSGGREHALCWAISKSPRCSKLFCAPGNAGISQVAERVNIPDTDVAALVAFAKKEKIQLCVVGPEAALVAGLVDKMTAAGIKAFGPSQAAAEIEGSKGFMKDLCAKYDIPTAKYARFDEPDAAKEYILAHGPRLVVKADGLAAGKGVVLCHNNNEAFAAIDHIMTERNFGEAGAEVVIEEFLKGEEASFFALVDGKNVMPLISAQDHKAVHDGDQGPNTGGMGAYSPAPVFTPAVEKRVMERIIRPTVAAMAAEGRPYKGVLYAGLMIEDGEPKLLEFNARFGDPECQVIMMRLKSDVVDALLASIDGTLDRIKLEWRSETALLVCMAAKGYPGSYAKGTEIKGLDKASALSNVQVFHAGTALNDAGKLVSNGGRVLGVTALGRSVGEAQARAYQAVDLIQWPDGFCRRDIGWRAVARENA
jgi:phosphoribosylamine--glycine ligase